VNRKAAKRRGATNGTACDLFTIHDLLFTIHESMTNEQIARRFNQMASLMEVRGEDPFRLRSYRMAAEAIETWPVEMAEVAHAQGIAGLLDIPGVGKALAGKIVELVETGTFDAWDRLTAETPATVLDLLELPGVGPKTAAMLHQKFKITSLDDLRTFAEGGGLEMADGVGPKTAERIKAALARR
jgi:DNA polymerase (family 10)